MFQRKYFNFKVFFSFFQYFLAILIILLIISFIHLNQVVEILFKMDISFFLLAMACYFLNNVLMTFRLKRILGEIGQKIRLKFVFWSHMAGMLLSDFTPLRSGYIYTAHSLNKKGIPIEKGVASITSTYIYDLLFKLSISFLGFLYFYTIFTSSTLINAIILAVLFIFSIIIAYFLFLYPPEYIEKKFVNNVILRKILDIGKQSRVIQRYVPYILTISVFGWILRGFQWFFIAAALHFNFNSFLDPFFMSPLLTLFSLIPITPAGVGIQEAAIIGFFSFMGYPAALAASFAISVRLSEILVDLIGIKEIFSKKIDNSLLFQHYNAIEGDIDEKAFSSDLLVQRYFQQRKTQCIQNCLHMSDNDILLDIGCGSGVQLGILQKKGYKLGIGIDLNKNALQYGKKKNIQDTSFILADVQYLPLKNNSVDKIICAEIIEHLQNPDWMIKEITRTLKKDGEVVITTPNENSIWGAYEVLWDLFGRGRNYGQTHLKFFTPKELKQLFASYSLTSAKTIFFLSPVAALVNNEKMLNLFIKIDKKFEDIGFGVSIIFFGKK